ncbi:helix-turn-helix domain-containing protein [Nonomuraea soli]|uniref:Transcriptional regulator with XRE-family HTH domain n=1 Tax=Nonomuraea soli TaxID=1032476 RepID=A0A7W0HRV8_9ACTN|nr:helix-turn-helix transcriptional regulator [Nonomuraea soli]MBA2893350.1 transcriptional regulator with XRE-family HTH domain [Nonomuraea soli]
MAGHGKWNTLKAKRLAGESAEEHPEYVQAGLDIQLGDMVRERRRALGLSQKEVAEAAGITQPALSRIEGGGGIPTLAMLDRIGKAMHTEFTFSVGETPARRHAEAAPGDLPCRHRESRERRGVRIGRFRWIVREGKAGANRIFMASGEAETRKARSKSL